MQKEHASGKYKELLVEIKKTKIELIIGLFRHLQAKDTFEAHYTKYLSKRLIHKKSESNDQEKRFVEKLKEECGY